MCITDYTGGLTMPETVTLDVALTRRDLKEYFFAANKRTIIFSAIAYGLLLLAVLFYIVSSVYLMYFSFLTTALFIAVYLFFGAMTFLSLYLRYRRLTVEFQSNTNIDKTMRYEFTALGFSVAAAHGHLSIGWRDIVRIVEYPTMFLLVQSLGKAGILPKRCFYGPAALNAFIGIVSAGVDKRKLRLKNYPFIGFDPAAPRQAPGIQSGNDTAAAWSAGKAPEIVLQAMMTKHDYLKYNFYHYYTGMSGILLTVLGLILFPLAAATFERGAAAMTLLFVVELVLGVYFVLGAPALILIQASRLYKTDASIKDTLTEYRFYGGHIEIQNEKGMSRRAFGEFRKLIRLKWAYLLYIAKNLAYVIPSRYIQDAAAFDRYFSYMQAENTRLKYAPAAPPPVPAAPPQAPPVLQARFCERCGKPRQSPEYHFCPACGNSYDRSV
jgi:hypothetical protein